MHSVRNILSFAILFCLLSPAAIAVVLSEVMFNPAEDEGTDEFIELHNEAPLPLNLTNWTISDGEGVDTLRSMGMGLTAAPGQFILIMDPDYLEVGSVSYDGLVPESAFIVTIDNSTFGSRGLSNSTAETITISMASGSVVAQYTYDIEVSPGHSNEKIILTNGDDDSNWTSSINVNGTPGGRNSVTPLNRDLGIISFSAEPTHPSPDESFRLRAVVKNYGLLSYSDSLLLYEYDLDSDSALILLDFRVVSGLACNDTIAYEFEIATAEVLPRSFEARLLTDDESIQNNSLLLTVGGTQEVSSILFNELMYRPAPGRSEWVELLNSTDRNISLDGWQFTDGSGIAEPEQYVTIADVMLAPGAFLLLASDSAALFEAIPDSIPIIFWNSSSPSLNNGGDSLVIYDDESQVIDCVDYRSNWGDDEAGISLERISVDSPANDPLNWASSLDSSGSTPGRANSRALDAAHATDALLILEPNPFSPDNDGKDDLLAVRYRLDIPDSRIDIKIFDVRGREVKRLANNRPAGYSGVLLWDGKSDTGRDLPTGMYIIYLEALGQGNTRIQSTKRVAVIARPS